MKIKKLSIHGFKSFVDKVDMTFPDGVINIVGPNGCGKSNVVDAIRWAMGEQSAKHLRGKLMEDVIFNGSESRKPVGMAEVSLTFDNGDGRAPAQYADFSEITVSRRLFRSGESEYYINKIPCRLRDITELFMDTGVGNRAYSIIEQGKIGAIVTMKPEERRSLIEEAAGITKYKTRKNSALKKIESTQQNLLRVRDVVREIKRQINALERQAKKAEKYKMLREKLKQLELSISALKLRDMSLLLDEEMQTMNAQTDVEAKLAASAAKYNKELLEKKAAAETSEKQLRIEQEKVHESSNRIVEYEQRIGFNERETERLAEEEKRYTEEIARLRERLKDFSERAKSLEQELEELRAQEIRVEGKLQNAEKDYEERIEKHGDKEKKLEKTRSEIIHIATVKSNLHNSILHLSERIDDLEVRLEKKKAEKEEAESNLKTLETKLQDINEKLESLYSFKISIDENKSEEINNLRRLRDNVEAKQDEENKLREDIHRFESRLQSLKELKENYEGAMAGVRSIMQRHSESPLMDGILGIAADFLEVPMEYESAVGAALDQKLQSIIVESQSKSIDAIRYLKENEAGRGTFLSVEAAQRSSDKDTTKSWAGEGIPLKDKIKVKKNFDWLADTLFHSTLFVDNLEDAFAARDSDFEGTLVTLDGEVIEQGGEITGGKGEGASYNLLKRERDIRGISSELEGKRIEYKKVMQERLGLIKESEDCEQKLDELKQKEFAKNIEIANLEKDRDSLSKEIGREAERRDITSMEEDQIASEIAEFRKETENSRKKLSEYEISEKIKTDEIKVLQEEIANLKTDLDEARHYLTDTKISRASLKEKSERIETELKNAGGSIDETKRLLERDEKLLSDGREKAADLLDKLTADKKTLGGMLNGNEELRSALAAKKDDYEQIMSDIRDKETILKELQRSCDDVTKKISSTRISLTEKELEIKHLINRMAERYNVDLSRDIDEIPLPQEGYAEELASLQRQIEDMGEVNLTALEAHKENVGRLTFLEEQEKDLLDAIESLKRAINRINKTSRKRFKDTFVAVNEKFREVFPVLFGGGKAELILTDENDLLETGVDIVAQPPGKRLQNMNLLSGGEKALTAITLIFSILLIKPSPFCLLDEVDAPLDEANVGRFNDIVKEMSKLSQIIMITHNKRSIEIGNILYGVTMEDPGISRLVSVELH